MTTFRRLVPGLIIGAACLAAALPQPDAYAYPRPSNIVTRWQLEFQAHEFRLFVDDDGSAYWYLSYTVANRTGRDQRWAPQFDLFTDDGRILPSGVDVPERVTAEILDLLGNPLLETQTQVIGDLLQGDTNARDGLAIWPAGSLEVTELTVFISGLSGESVRVRNIQTGKDVVLRKTLRRDYLVPGEPLARRSRPYELVGEEWIMR